MILDGAKLLYPSRLLCAPGRNEYRVVYRACSETLEDCLVKLQISRICDAEDTYGRTLAYLYLDTGRNNLYQRLFNEDLIAGGYARTTDFPHTYSREFERLEEAEERGASLRSASCPDEPP